MFLLTLTLRVVPLVLVAALVLAALPAQAWSVHDMGGSYVKDLAVGDGDNDGKSEVYAATEVGVFVYVVSGTSWTETALIRDVAAYSIAVGDGDRDGKNEVYAGIDDGLVYRFAKSGGTWSSHLILNLSSQYQLETLTVGDLEQDGKKELYTSIGEGKVLKLFKDGGVWKRLNLTNADWAATSWIGDGDRDGRPELYLGTYDKVYQVQSKGDGRWQSAVILRGPCCYNGVVVGDGDGNGKPEIYTASWDKTVRKVWLDGSVWRNQTIATLPDLGRDLTTIDINNDGDQELYAAGHDGALYEIRWTGSSWAKTNLGDASDYVMTTVAAGDGDRDGEREVYGGILSGDEGVHEYDP